ncbi:MAG: polysaccharide biosynthesis protein [Holosporaceae bacterium]|jgi:hypothetical protein|nr:polysaccharide biosynthesis protein [Holosporaceae bacterium]
MLKFLLKKVVECTFPQKIKEVAYKCYQELLLSLNSVPEKYIFHIKNFSIVLLSYGIASFFIYPEFNFSNFLREVFSLACTYCAVFLWFGDKIENEISFRMVIGVTACAAPVLFVNNPFGVAFVSLWFIVFCEFLIFEYKRGCNLFSDLIPVYIICENESEAEQAVEFFSSYRVLELVVLSGENHYGSMKSIKDVKKWLSKINRVPFYPSPRRLLYLYETLNRDTFSELLEVSASFSIPLFKANKNTSLPNTLSIAPISFGDLETIDAVTFDKAALSASFKGKRVWICYDGRESILDLIYAISSVGSVDMTICCESEKLMFEVEQELSCRCSGKNYKIKVMDLRLLELQPSKPDVFFYNMPIKSVRSCEENLKEAVVKNVLETRHIINFAQSNKIPIMFILSSSGALNARNWIGATQRLGELFAQFADSQHRKTFTKFKIIRIPNNVSDPSGIFGKVISSIFANGCINDCSQSSELNTAYYRKDILPLLTKVVTFLMKGNDATSSVYTITPKNNVTFNNFVKNVCNIVCLRKGSDVQVVQDNQPKEMELDDFIDINEPLEKTAVPGLLRTKFSCADPASYSSIWTFEEVGAMTTRELISAVFQSVNEKIKVT